MVKETEEIEEIENIQPAVSWSELPRDIWKYIILFLQNDGNLCSLLFVNKMFYEFIKENLKIGALFDQRYAGTSGCKLADQINTSKENLTYQDYLTYLAYGDLSKLNKENYSKLEEAIESAKKASYDVRYYKNILDFLKQYNSEESKQLPYIYESQEAVAPINLRGLVLYYYMKEEKKRWSRLFCNNKIAIKYKVIQIFEKCLFVNCEIDINFFEFKNSTFKGCTISFPRGGFPEIMDGCRFYDCKINLFLNGKQENNNRKISNCIFKNCEVSISLKGNLIQNWYLSRKDKSAPNIVLDKFENVKFNGGALKVHNDFFIMHYSHLLYAFQEMKISDDCKVTGLDGLLNVSAVLVLVIATKNFKDYKKYYYDLFFSEEKKLIPLNFLQINGDETKEKIWNMILAVHQTARSIYDDYYMYCPSSDCMSIFDNEVRSLFLRDIIFALKKIQLSHEEKIDLLLEVTKLSIFCNIWQRLLSPPAMQLEQRGKKRKHAELMNKKNKEEKNKEEKNKEEEDYIITQKRTTKFFSGKLNFYQEAINIIIEKLRLLVNLDKAYSPYHITIREAYERLDLPENTDFSKVEERYHQLISEKNNKDIRGIKIAFELLHKANLTDYEFVAEIPRNYL